MNGWVNGTCFAPNGRAVFLRVENDARVEICAYDLFAAGKLAGVTEYEKETTVIRGSYPQSLFASPDGRLLACLQWDRPALVWDAARLAVRPPELQEVSAEELERLWSALGQANPGEAYPAMARLLGAPGPSLRFLQAHVRPVAPADPHRLQQLLADLDSDQFAVREGASQELAGLGEQVAPALRTALQGKPSLETRQRLERLLQSMSGPPPAGTLRTLRGIQVLERLGSPEARQVLQSLSRGAAAAPETRDAQAALQRLARRPAASP